MKEHISLSFILHQGGKLPYVKKKNVKIGL